VLRPAKSVHDSALEGYEERHVADLLMREISRLAPSDERWGVKFIVPKESDEHHVEDEAKSGPQTEKLGANERSQECAVDPHGRLLLVRWMTERGWTAADAANAARISERQSYRWLARYRNGGATALADRNSAPNAASIASALNRSAKSSAWSGRG